MVKEKIHPRQVADDAQELFARYLKDRRIKSTDARRRILDAVLQLKEHFETEQLAEHLKVQGYNVGKATVYRSLPLLVDCGILKQVRFDSKQAFYELAMGEDPHDHMVCRRCGCIVEFGAGDVVELRTRLARQHHFHAISHRFQISGLCWDCSIACPVAGFSISQPNESAGIDTRRPRRKSRRA
jgi:Fur family ferric uptake transcriptional regulator